MYASGNRWNTLQLRVGQRLLNDPNGELVLSNAEMVRKIKEHQMYALMRIGPMAEACWLRISDSVALARTMYKDEALLKEMLRQMDGIAKHGLHWDAQQK